MDSGVRCRENLEVRLLGILNAHPWFMDAVDAVSEMNLPNWYVGGGAIRTIVFDRLAGHSAATPVRDVDVAYFDPGDLSKAREEKVEAVLGERMPGVRWDVTNQAGVHLWFHHKFGGDKVPPYGNTEEAIATWPEPCSSVAVTRTASGACRIHAPLGLEDLFGMIVRRNPARVNVETYRERIRQKKFAQHWKMVKIVFE